MQEGVISGISHRFQQLSQSQGQVTHVLLTRSPLITRASPGSPFDLHVLSTPPAFVLSQNQTLRKCLHGTPTTKAAGQPTHETDPPPARRTIQVRSDQSHAPHQRRARTNQPNQPTTNQHTHHNGRHTSQHQTKMASTTWHTVEFSKSGRASRKTLPDPPRGNRTNLPDQPKTVNHPTPADPPPGTTNTPTATRTTEPGTTPRKPPRDRPTEPKLAVRSSLPGGEEKHYDPPPEGSTPLRRDRHHRP